MPSSASSSDDLSREGAHEPRNRIPARPDASTQSRSIASLSSTLGENMNALSALSSAGSSPRSTYSASIFLPDSAGALFGSQNAFDRPLLVRGVDRDRRKVERRIEVGRRLHAAEKVAPRPYPANRIQRLAALLSRVCRWALAVRKSPGFTSCARSARDRPTDVAPTPSVQ